MACATLLARAHVWARRRLSCGGCFECGGQQTALAISCGVGRPKSFDGVCGLAASVFGVSSCLFTPEELSLDQPAQAIKCQNK